MPCLAPVSIDENKTEANYSTAFEKIKISPDFRENHGNIQHIGHKYLNRITKEAEHN